MLNPVATEMRTMRVLAAQDKANRLPVQMSGVMSSLMRRSLFLLTLTPIIIRYIAMMGQRLVKMPTLHEVQ